MKTAVAIAILVSGCLSGGLVLARTAPPSLTRQQRELLQALITAVDRAPASPEPADHAWLTHVLRVSNGAHYVAFSVTPPAETPLKGPLVVYVRLATAQAGASTAVERSVVREWLLGSRIDPRLLPSKRGFAVGDMPAMGAGTAGNRGAATVGSADLQIMEMQRERARERKADQEKQRRAALEGGSTASAGTLPFEDFDVVAPATFADGTRAIQRALTAGPGVYELWVAWSDSSQPAAKAQIHVARRSLQLAPAAAEFGLSSVIVADQIGVRQAPYSPIEQRAHPYAIGLTEIVPARDSIFTPNDQLSVAFQIVNPTPSASGKPDVQVSLQIVRLIGVREEPIAALSPLAYDATTLPADLDVRLGHPVIAAMSAPLATIPRGDYRLLIMAEDRVSGTVVAARTGFSVVGTPASLLAEAPALGASFDVKAALHPTIVATVLDRLSPVDPSPAIAKSLQSARAGRFADLLVEEPVAPDEEGVRAALRGLALLSLGNPGAIAQFERALQSPVAAAPVQFLMGAARAMQNRDTEAVAAWQAARNGGLPGSITDRFVAEAQLRRRDFHAAAGAIARSDDVASNRTLAATRIAIRREAEAVAVLDTLLAGTPDDAEARWLLVHALYSEFVHGRRDRRERLVSEATRYVDAKGPHSVLAAEWLKVITSS